MSWSGSARDRGPGRTLVDRDAAFARWLESFCAGHRLDAEVRTWLADLDVRHRHGRRRFFAEMVAGLGLREEPDSLWRDYRSTIPRLAEAFAGVPEGLAGLRAAGWSPAVLSNGESDNQRGKLEHTGLLEYFPICRFSGETGLRKPDPEAFRDVLDRARVPASATWMVGDDAELDVVGARRIGLSTMWIRHGRPWPTRLDPPTRSVPTPAQGLRALAAAGSP